MEDFPALGLLLETDQIRDPRLLRRLNLICSQMVVHQSAIVNQFSKEHKEKMGAYRFLNNYSVSSDAILSGLIHTCCKNASGRQHLLCIQDTSEINLSLIHIYPANNPPTGIFPVHN